MMEIIKLFYFAILTIWLAYLLGVVISRKINEKWWGILIGGVIGIVAFTPVEILKETFR